MSFGIYIIGYLIGIGGLTYVASLMHVPRHFRRSPVLLKVPVVSAGRQKN
jgi:hypothetical protein